MKKIFFLKFEIFQEKHPPTRHIKYKRIDFATCNKSIMANKLLSTITLRKMIIGEIFFKFKLNFLNDINKFRQNWLVKKSKFVWRKKPTPNTNIPLLSLQKSEQLRKFFKIFFF